MTSFCVVMTSCVVIRANFRRFVTPRVECRDVTSDCQDFTGPFGVNHVSVAGLGSSETAFSPNENC